MGADYASLQDIDVFAREKGAMSVLEMLDTCQTMKGSLRLNEILRHPLHSREDILQMQDCLAIIAENGGRKGWRFPQGQIEGVEKYHLSNILLLKPGNFGFRSANRFFFELRHRTLADALRRHMGNFLEFLHVLKELPISRYSKSPEPLRRIGRGIEAFFATKLPNGRTVDEALPEWRRSAPLTLDWTFRFFLKDEIKRLLESLYELDMLFSLAEFNLRNGLVRPTVLPEGSFRIEARNLRHLFLRQGRGNDVTLGSGKSVYFLTGPNMAGKSTLLKSIGLAVYLGHLGLGVPAESMAFVTLGGMLTSITISDSLKLGNSYYMSEVKRVKDAVSLACRVESCLLLFDETFKGTNVMDASDASYALVTGLSRQPNAMVFFSSHLHEVAEKLAGVPNVMRVKMEAVNGSSEFTYRLQDGISTQRLGMHLLKEEGILGILESMGREQPLPSSSRLESPKD